MEVRGTVVFILAVVVILVLIIKSLGNRDGKK
jgi:hypothetical protein